MTTVEEKEGRKKEAVVASFVSASDFWAVRSSLRLPFRVPGSINGFSIKVRLVRVYIDYRARFIAPQWEPPLGSDRLLVMSFINRIKETFTHESLSVCRYPREQVCVWCGEQMDRRLRGEDVWILSRTLSCEPQRHTNMNSAVCRICAFHSCSLAN